MGDLTQDQLDRLLDWLDPDRDAAALKYAKIQLRITRIFACRGCWEAETLADYTFDRVAAKVEWLIENYVGDPILYFYGVAQNVYREWLRKITPVDCSAVFVAPPEAEVDEQAAECLTSCLKELPSENSNLVLRYYEGEKQAKITNRKRLAEELGITLDALRIRAHRIRRELRKCVLKCLELVPEH